MSCDGHVTTLVLPDAHVTSLTFVPYRAAGSEREPEEACVCRGVGLVQEVLPKCSGV